MSAITTDTVQNLVLDAGIVYLNYGAGGGTERILGATEGGNTFTVEREIREVPVDGTKGKTKGLRRIITENATLTVNLKEVSPENIQLALAGSTKTTGAIKAPMFEYLGEGLVTAETFTFKQEPVVSSLKFFVNGVAVDWKLGEEFFMPSATEMTLSEAETLAVDDELTVSYIYLTGETATHEEIVSGDIGDDDYITSVALVATVSGSDQPIVCTLYRVLSDGDFEIGATDKEEAVVPVEFSAHYDPSDLDLPLYSISYPVIS